MDTNMTQPKEGVSRVTFLDLPGELRNMIYRLAVTTDMTSKVPIKTPFTLLVQTPSSTVLKAFNATSAQVRREVLSMNWTTGRFTVARIPPGAGCGSVVDSPRVMEKQVQYMFDLGDPMKPRTRHNAPVEAKHRGWVEGQQRLAELAYQTSEARKKKGKKSRKPTGRMY